MSGSCTRCHQEPRIAGQSWGRACFARYRRQQRAGRRKAGGQQGPPQEPATQPTQGTRDEEPGFPSLTVKVHPYGLKLRFVGGRLHPEDAPILAKLQPGTFYAAHAWIEREARKR